MQNQTLKIEGVRKYSFTDDKTGRLVEGVNVYFLQEEHDEHTIGKIPAKISLPITAWNKVSRFHFPCECAPEFKQEFSAKGVRTKVVDLHQVKQAVK